jgi:hypothetical protein
MPIGQDRRRRLNRKSLAQPAADGTSLQVTTGIGCEAQPSPRLGDLERVDAVCPLSHLQGVPAGDTRDYLRGDGDHG